MTEAENRKIEHGRFSLYREHKLRFSAGKRRVPKSALAIRVWEPERFQGPKRASARLPGIGLGECARPVSSLLLRLIRLIWQTETHHNTALRPQGARRI